MTLTKSKPKKAAASSSSSSEKGAASNGRPTTAKTQKPVESSAQKARRSSILLKHLSDSTRLQLILLLSDGEKHVGELCAQVNQSQPAVSHHLALLRHGSVITPRRQGKNNFYNLTETGELLATVVRAITD